MIKYKLGEVEMRFADIIWGNEPLSSGELVRLAANELSWNRSTTYTILRRLCERGMFENEKGTVRSLITKADFISAQSEKFVEEIFSGSLPDFLASFSKRKKLSDKDIDEIQRFIDERREE